MTKLAELPIEKHDIGHFENTVLKRIEFWRHHLGMDGVWTWAHMGFQVKGRYLDCKFGKWRHEGIVGNYALWSYARSLVVLSFR